MRIAICAESFMGWSGGIGFLSHIYEGLRCREEQELFLFVPREKSWMFRFKKMISPRYVSNDAEELLQAFEGKNIKVCYYEKLEIVVLGMYDRGKGLARALEEHEIDVCLPVMSPYIDYDKLPVPHIEYMYDFQHKKMPQLFSEKEIQRRDIEFRKMLYSAGNIVVNAKSVQEDIKTYYPDAPARIFTLPFAPLCDRAWIDIARENEYGRYFIISNQFWKHKDHLTAFKALEQLYREGYTDVKLLCTGKMQDDRFPEYIDEIRNTLEGFGCRDNIVFLGYVDKELQIGLIKNALAMVQPTHFEGGPGGGAVFNALSVGTTCIVSDIPVNKEIGGEYDVVFFRTGDAGDLAEKMKYVLERGKRGKTREELVALRERILSEYAEYLYGMIAEVREAEET